MAALKKLIAWCTAKENRYLIGAIVSVIGGLIAGETTAGNAIGVIMAAMSRYQKQEPTTK